jgi:hypothetical protein
MVQVDGSGTCWIAKLSKWSVPFIESAMNPPHTVESEANVVVAVIKVGPCVDITPLGLRPSVP